MKEKTFRIGRKHVTFRFARFAPGVITRWSCFRVAPNKNQNWSDWVLNTPRYGTIY